jgi:hypothetical protein
MGGFKVKGFLGIYSGFRVWVLFLLLMQDPDLITSYYLGSIFLGRYQSSIECLSQITNHSYQCIIKYVLIVTRARNTPAPN